MSEDQEPYTAEPPLDEIRRRGEPFEPDTDAYAETSLAVDPIPFGITATRAGKLIDAMEEGNLQSIPLQFADWKYIFAVKENTWERKLDDAEQALDDAEQALDDRDTRQQCLCLALSSATAVSGPEVIINSAKLYFEWVASGRTPARQGELMAISAKKHRKP